MEVECFSQLTMGIPICLLGLNRTLLVWALRLLYCAIAYLMQVYGGLKFSIGILAIGRNLAWLIKFLMVRSSQAHYPWMVALSVEEFVYLFFLIEIRNS